MGPLTAFSVVVPTYNRLGLLKKTLGSLFSQDHPDYEIIVINDGSSDGTREYLDSLQAEGRLRCHHQENQGPARGRNRGIELARHELVAFIDDDCIAPASWLSQYAGRFREWNCDGIGGSGETGDKSNICALTNDHIMNFFKSRNAVSNGPPFLTSNNVAYRKPALESVGGFDPRFRMGAEDRDLNLRLVESGATLCYDPAIVIGHFNNESLPGFIRHQMAYGRGSRRLYDSAKARRSRIVARASSSTYLDLLKSPFQTFRFIEAFKALFLILVAQAAVTVGYFTAPSQRTGGR